MSSDLTGSAVEKAFQEAAEASNKPQLRRRSRLELLLLLLPAFLFQLAWGIYPLIISVIMSFTDAQPILPSKFTGLASYIRVWNDPLVKQAFGVNIYYAVLSILLTFVTPILVAILLMEMPPRAMRWMMVLWFLPLSTIGSTVLWKYLYDTNVGLFQYIATSILHLPPQAFLGDPNQVLFWLIFPGFVLFGPGLIYIAGLQSIPQSYYEAAEVEGAGFWRKIWTISLPRLRPIISMLLTFAIIGSLQEFSWPQLMTQGNPAGASRLIVMYLYQYITDQRYSDATALAMYLFIFILLIVILFRVFFKEDPDA